MASTIFTGSISIKPSWHWVDGIDEWGDFEFEYTIRNNFILAYIDPKYKHKIENCALDEDESTQYRIQEQIHDYICYLHEETIPDILNKDFMYTYLW